MADQIRETVRLEGDESGATEALRNVSSEMGAVERRASQVASRIQSFGNGVMAFLGHIGSGVAKVGGIAAGAGSLAAKGLGGLALAGGAVAGVLSGIGSVAGTAAAGLGVLTQKALSLASVSDQARSLSSTWGELKAIIASPFVHFAAQSFAILNNALRDPAVQQLARQFALLATVILRSVLPAVSALAGAITAFARAFAAGDWANIFKRTWDGFVEGWKSAGKSAGAAAGASFGQAWEEEAAKAAKSASSPSGALRGGFLSNIGDLGTSILNAMLSGFKKADFNVLQQAAEAITSRLQTLFKRGQVSEISIVPRTIGAQTAVAEALRDANAQGGLTEAIIERVRERLSALGPEVQDFVEQLLRARQATQDVERATQAVADAQQRLTDAQTELSQKQADYAQAQTDLAEMQSRHAEDAQELADELFDAETKLAALQADQEERLARLASLRRAVADAAEEQYQAELRVRAAQEALIPLQERLRDARERERQLSEEIAEAQRQRNEAIREAQTALADQLDSLQHALDHVADRYKDQLDAQQKIIDAVEQRWRAELEGASEALRLAQKRFDLEDSRQKKASLEFARRRAEAQLIGDPNQRIAALAKINREEARFNERNRDRLETARIEAELAEKTLREKEAARDAEKAEALAEIARIQGLIEADRQLLHERIKSVREEGEARIKQMQRASEEAAREEASRLRSAAADTASAQSKVDAAQRTLDAAQREAELAGHKRTDAEHELAAREATVHLETDGAISTAKERVTGLQEAQRLAAHNADLEERPLKGRLETARTEMEAAQAQVNAAQTHLGNANSALASSQTTLDNYKEAGELALARVQAEQRTADLIAQQRDLLQAIADQQAKAAGAGGGGVGDGGFGGADLAKQLAKPFSEEEISAFTAKWRGLFKALFDKLKEIDLSGFWQSILDKGVKYLQEHPEALLTIGALISKGMGGGATLGFFLGEMLIQDPAQALALIGQNPLTIIGGAIGLALGGPAGAAFLGGFGQALDRGWKEWLTTWAQGETTKAVGEGVVKSLDLPGNLRLQMAEMEKAAADEEAQRRIKNILLNPYTWWWDELFGHSIFPDAVAAITGFFRDLPPAIGKYIDRVRDVMVQPFEEAVRLIGSAARGAGSFLGDLWANVTGSFHKIQNDARPIVERTTENVSSLWRGAKEAVVGASGRQGLVGDIAAGIDGSLKATRDSAVGTTGQGGIVGSLVGGITSLFGAAKDSLTAPGTGTLATMAREAEARARELRTAVTGENSPISKTKDDMVRAFTDANTDISHPDRGALASLGPNLVSVLKTTAAVLFGADGKGGAIGLLTSGVVTAFGVAFGPRDQHGTILWLLLHDDKPGGNKDGGLFPAMEYWIRDRLNWQKVEVWQSALNDLKNTLVNYVGEGGRFRKDLENAFENIGKLIGDAIAKGMLARMGAIKEAARELVKAAEEAAKQEAGINSPARRFIPLGLHSGEGYGVGLMRAVAFVRRMAGRLIEAAERVMAARSIASISLPSGYDSTLALAGVSASSRLGSPSVDNRTFNAGVVNQYFDRPGSDLAAQEWHDLFTR